MTIETSPSNSYLDAFLTERPKDGIEVIQGRLRKALKLNEELAEYFKDRAYVEDLYAKNLAKISKKHFITDKSALGHMQPIWEMLHNELTEIYTIHAVMSLKITEDVERPLRSSIQNDNEYHAIKSMDAALQRLSRDYEERSVRLNKHKKAASKPGSSAQKAELKLADSTKGLDEVKNQWMKTGPDYIQKHQTVDEHRWNNLQKVVQNFEVLQNDQLLKRIEVANNVLTAASNFNVQDEINAFCSSHGSKSGLSKAVSTIQMNQQSQQSKSSSDEQQQPQQQQIPTVSRSERSIASLASTSTKNTARSDVLSVPSNNGSQHLEAPVPVPSISDKSNRSGRKVGKERKFLSTLVSIRRKTKSTYMGGSDSNSINNGYVNADLAPPDVLSDQKSHSSFSALDEEDHSSIHTNDHNNNNTTTTTTANNDDSPSTVPTSPTSMDQSVSSLKKAPSFTGSFASTQQQQQQPPKVLVDAEGYTIPPPDRAAWPGDNSTNNGSSLHDDDFFSDNGSVFSSNQQPKLKVDIKNETVKEEDAQQSAVALTRVSSMLKEKSPSASGKRRGRRDNQRGTRLLDPVQEFKQPTGSPLSISSTTPMDDTIATTTTSTSPFDDGSNDVQQVVQLHDDTPVQLQGSPVIQSSPTPVEKEASTGVQLSDAAPPVMEQSTVASFVALAATAKPNIKVQITESIHCLMKGGAVVRSAVLGEVKIAYHGPADTERPVCFRLEHVEQLERITPNTSYITEEEEEGEGGGVYKLDTNMFHLAGDSPIACIKYQVKLNNDDDELLPIKVKPMWKCESEQTLLLVKYQKTKRDLASHLHGIFFMTTVSGSVQNVQSVPGGQWMVDQDKMVWPMGEWQGDEERILRAKFITKEQGIAQNLQVRFEVKDRLVSSLHIVDTEKSTDKDETKIWANVESTEKSIRTGKYIAEQ